MNTTNLEACFDPWVCPPSFGHFVLTAESSDCLHIVRWQHPSLSSALHGAVHPAFIDGLNVDDDIPVFEGHLVIVRSGIVIHGTHRFLGEGTMSSLQLKQLRISL